MDFSPLDISATLLFGEKGALSDVKTTNPGQADTAGSENKDTYDANSKQEMGKTTSNGLKRPCGAKGAATPMAPQKLWTSETLMPSHMKRITSKLDELVQDIRLKGLDMELQKIIDNNIHKDMCTKDQSGTVVTGHECQERHTCNVLSNGNKLSDVDTESQSPHLITDSENTKNMLTIEKEQNHMRHDKSFSNPHEGTVNFKPQDINQTPNVFICETVVLDHPYALSPDHRQPLAFEDDDVDIGSDSSPLSEETDQRYQNLSMGCSYLKFGINNGAPISALDLNKKFNSCSTLQSPSSSISSLTSDIVSRSSQHILSGDENGDIYTGMSSPEPESYIPTSVHPRKPAQKNERYGTGSFRSISCSNLELEEFLKHKDHTSSKRLNNGTPTNPHFISSFNSSSTFPNLHPLLQSPTLDWDRSEASSETQEDSPDVRNPHRMTPDFTDKVTEWLHPVHHDHDYYAKDTESISSFDDIGKFESFSVSEDFGKCKRGKRKFTTKSKLDGLHSEKIMKAKYLKKELLRKGSCMISGSQLESVSADLTITKTNPVGRPRKKPLDKIVDEEIDPETGTKLKITGQFQDQYVYYLSKSSRTRTRGRQISASHLTSDKITIPAPNPGDIVIPHLTDADIEALRVKGRGAASLSERPHLATASARAVPCQPVIPLLDQSSEFVSDVDSHIVSTILSMEDDSIASTEASDIISTAGLNPNQPGLTESLRLMSGDPSITSELVLHYLLSMVKDEGFLNNGHMFDSSNSGLLPPLPPDSINNKVYHTGDPDNTVCGDLSSFDTTVVPSLSSGHDLLDIAKSTHCTNSFDGQASHAHKDFIDGSNCLPEYLSSFISESKGMSSHLNGDSHSSVKTTVESDFSSLGIPNISSSIHRLTSIEKTLDYLGVTDEDMKLDNSVFTTRIDHTPISSKALTSVSSTIIDDTPWIVTVTLYFNDVPAIMIENQPYIRLVDIHKQILPAKDTGILKKRCQLLKIPVICCTEMQRYFLVQYGRAYNSKSTLIVSKGHATDLVTYYATPQPRMARTTEAHQSRIGRPQNVRLPVAHLPSGNNKRLGCKATRRLSESLSLPVSEGIGESLSQLPQKNTVQECEAVASSPGKRTRHRKINYLDLLKGEGKDASFDAAILETIESVAKSTPDRTHEKLVKDTLPNSNISDVMNKKLASIYRKKSSEVGPTIIQRSIVGKTKKRNKDSERVERAIDVCSDIDSDGSIDVSQSKKFRPLKLKVKSLLNFARQWKVSSPSKQSPFSHSSSSTPTATERPLRVLPVAHQTALSDINAESHLPSQAADIHLDLFVKSNSACVHCTTCSQFLSVPHFMRHHHVPMNSEWLATEAAQRILVPRNKENISQQEQQLWAEFHHLQEAIGGFGEADDETDSDDGTDDSNEDQHELDLLGCDDVDQTSLTLSDTQISSVLNVERSSGQELHVKDQTKLGLSSTYLDPPTTVEDGKLCDYLESGKKPSIPNSPMNLDKCGLSNTVLLSEVIDSITPRTSTRKRKSKQLFSIENYYTPKKWLISEGLSS